MPYLIINKCIIFGFLMNDKIFLRAYLVFLYNFRAYYMIIFNDINVCTF